jgi:hypothetical protein
MPLILHSIKLEELEARLHSFKLEELLVELPPSLHGGERVLLLEALLLLPFPFKEINSQSVRQSYPFMFRPN